jgi:hypothetical protein
MTKARPCFTCKRVRIFLTVVAWLFAGPVAFGQTTSAEEIQAQAQARLRQQEAELLARKLALEPWIDQTNAARELLTTLSREAKVYSARLETLLTSDEGKRLADEKYFFEALPFYELPPLDAQEIESHKKTAETLLTSLNGELSSGDLGTLPVGQIQKDIGKTLWWAQDRLATLNERKASLESLLQRAPTLGDPSTAHTLKQAIADYHARRTQLYAKSRQVGEKLGLDESQEVIATSAYQAELEKGLHEAQRLLQEERAKLATMQVEFQVRQKLQDEENARRLAESDRKFQDAMAENDRLNKKAEAKRQADDTAAEIEANKIVADSEKQRLVARCQDPQVQARLKPFLAQGYYQPGVKAGTFDKHPVSLGLIRRLGGLEATVKGLQTLVVIATDVNDRERPRWPKEWRSWNTLAPKQREEIKAAQRDLIELGEVMVELKMLAN